MQSLKSQVLARDGHVCVRCGAALDSSTARVDRVSKLESDKKPSNLRTLCAPCYVLRLIPGREGLRAQALADGIIPPDWRSLVWDDDELA